MTFEEKRDKFAAAALTGILANQGDISAEKAADDAYTYAIAMLEYTAEYNDEGGSDLSRGILGK